MNKIQPKMKALQDKYKNDPQTMQLKLGELYKEENYNPASGCLVLIVQMPIILAFFKVQDIPAGDIPGWMAACESANSCGNPVERELHL